MGSNWKKSSANNGFFSGCRIFSKGKINIFFQIFFFKNFLREDRRRGIHGHDYGEDDDEIDYSKKYDDDTALLVIILDFYF